MTSWDERYGAADYYYGTEANEFLRENCSKIRRGGDVLCLAEGEGGATGRSKGSADPYGPRQPRWLPYRTDAVGWHRVHLVPTLAQLREELKGLEFAHAVGRERKVHEGGGHHGLSAVVQVVAHRRC